MSVAICIYPGLVWFPVDFFLIKEITWGLPLTYWQYTQSIIQHHDAAFMILQGSAQLMIYLDVYGIQSDFSISHSIYMLLSLEGYTINIFGSVNQWHCKHFQL